MNKHLRDAFASSNVANTLFDNLVNKERFLTHQKRDLPACHSSEKEWRLQEIKELEEEVQSLNEAIKEYAKLLE